MQAALNRIDAIQGRCEQALSLTPETFVEGLSVRNLATVSALVLRACLNRQETRSSHYRIDFPENDASDYKCSFTMQRAGDRDGVVLRRLTYQEG